MKAKTEVVAIALQHGRATPKALSVEGRYFWYSHYFKEWRECRPAGSRPCIRFKNACALKGRKVVKGKLFIEVSGL